MSEVRVPGGCDVAAHVGQNSSTRVGLLRGENRLCPHRITAWHEVVPQTRKSELQRGMRSLFKSERHRITA